MQRILILEDNLTGKDRERGGGKPVYAIVFALDRERHLKLLAHGF